MTDADGRRLRSSTTEDPTPGAPLGDVWDIGIVAPVARERTGYPTQKPEALLRRLIEACTEPGDWVLDPYCGSGTTLAVCKQIGRRAIGIDSSPQALKISRKRLKELGVRPREERVVLVPRAEAAGGRAPRCGMTPIDAARSSAFTCRAGRSRFSRLGPGEPRRGLVRA